MRYNELMFLVFFKWWYGVGWLEAWRESNHTIKKIQQGFSIPVLTKNLFSPWKQIITAPGKSFDEKFKAAIDNLVSRSVGFGVRSLTLVAAVVVISITVVVCFFSVLVWPLLPIAFVYSTVRAIVG